MQNEREYYTYILANHRGMFYVGVTGDLYNRLLQHRSGKGSVYTTKYQCHRLVYYEAFEYIHDAIVREKQIKGYTRAKKGELIKATNPLWKDLFEEFEGV